MQRWWKPASSIPSASASASPIAIVITTCLALGACDDRPVHIFGAERYDPVRDCLEAPAAVDVLDGPDPGPCAELRCWQSPSGEVYVTSTACGSPPDFADRSSDPPGSLCAEALDAFAREARCAATDP
jgi:hypothetical protein